ncbi:MAG: glycine betaine transporter [Arenicella sp.]|jgi:glycine betaine transporter
MQIILSIAIIVVLLTSAMVLTTRGSGRLTGKTPVGSFTFIAILFTSGLDVGLVMFPLTEFPIYQTEAAYQFANPLAVAFGFWGFLIWTFYFLTTFYFCAVEPRLKLFEIPALKFVNNVVIIGTCAFTGFLFLSYLPDYIVGITPSLKYGLVAVVTLFAVLSSTHVRYVKVLSIASTWLFFALIGFMFFTSEATVVDFGVTAVGISEYFKNLHHFVLPVSDYHAFYLFWWFSWSIMIGQFVARFVGDLSVRQLFAALLIFPSIPIATWFSVLYFYHENSVVLAGYQTIAMVSVGIIFVTNSLDSLTRLYTDNLNLTVSNLGLAKYIALHWSLIFGLVILYQFTPLKIEWIGVLVIALYVAVYALVFRRRRQLTEAV